MCDEKRSIYLNKLAPLDQIDHFVTLNSTGTRSNVIYFDGESYKSIVHHLRFLKRDLIKNSLISILNNGFSQESFFEELLSKDKVFLIKFCYLIFILETERNLSTFIIAPIFFELLSQKKLNLSNLLLNKLKKTCLFFKFNDILNF